MVVGGVGDVVDFAVVVGFMVVDGVRLGDVVDFGCCSRFCGS